MYLSKQNELPKPPGAPAGDAAHWRLHFEYPLETEQEADRHAAVCNMRELRVKRDEDGRPVRRRLTVAVLTLSDDERNELSRLTASTACSWTDTFDKETGRRTALARLTTRLKAGTDDWPKKEDGKTLALAVRWAYNQRPRYKPLPEALGLLKRVVEQSERGEVATVADIRTFLKQFE